MLALPSYLRCFCYFHTVLRELALLSILGFPCCGMLQLVSALGGDYTTSRFNFSPIPPWSGASTTYAILGHISVRSPDVSAYPPETKSVSIFLNVRVPADYFRGVVGGGRLYSQKRRANSVHGLFHLSSSHKHRGSPSHMRSKVPVQGSAAVVLSR